MLWRNAVNFHFYIFQMELSEVLESIKDIALYIFISIYLIFKILKYFVSPERLKVKKESLSVFGSIDTTPSLSVKPILDEHALTI